MALGKLRSPRTCYEEYDAGAMYSSLSELANLKRDRGCLWDCRMYTRGRYSTPDVPAIGTCVPILETLLIRCPSGYPFQSQMAETFTRLDKEFDILATCDPEMDQHPRENRPGLVADRWRIVMKHAAELALQPPLMSDVVNTVVALVGQQRKRNR